MEVEATKKKKKGMPFSGEHLRRMGVFLLRPPMLAAIIAFIIMTVALLIDPVIGMADNGDFYRAAIPVGIYKLDRHETDQYLSYASTTYGELEYYNEYGQGSAAVTSSQTVFIFAAKVLDSIFTPGDYLFDIRFLGVILMIYLSCAIYMLVDFATHNMSPVSSYVVAALFVFVLADTGYTAYFNSFYAEGVVYVSFLSAIGAFLRIAQKRSERFPVGMTVIFCVNVIILVTAKQQNAPLGLLFGAAIILAGLLIPYRRKLSASILERAEARDMARRVRRAFTVCGLGLMAVGVAAYLMIPQEYVDINSYHAVTRGVTLSSDDPEVALEDMGIDGQYALLNKTIYYSQLQPIGVASEKLQKDFYSNVDFFGILAHYATDWNSLQRMLQEVMKNAWAIRPASMGNYDRSAGYEPGAKTSFFTGWSSFVLTATPKTLGFWVVWALVVMVLMFKNKSVLVVAATVILTGAAQGVISVVGAGDADMSKHIFLFNAAFDIATLMSLSKIVAFLINTFTPRKLKARLEKRRAMRAEAAA